MDKNNGGGDQIESMAWNIKIEEGDGPKNIKKKNKIRKVLMMHKKGKTKEEINKETGLTEDGINIIIHRETAACY